MASCCWRILNDRDWTFGFCGGPPDRHACVSRTTSALGASLTWPIEDSGVGGGRDCPTGTTFLDRDQKHQMLHVSGYQDPSMSWLVVHITICIYIYKCIVKLLGIMYIYWTTYLMYESIKYYYYYYYYYYRYYYYIQLHSKSRHVHRNESLHFWSMHVMLTLNFKFAAK